MNDWRYRLRLTVTTADTESVELLTSMNTVLFGLWLLLPGQTFDGATVWRYFEMIPENVWGAVGLTIGLTSLFAMVFNQRHLRELAQYICVSWWIIVIGLAIAGNPVSPLIAFSLTQATGRLWTALRLLGIIRRPRLGLIEFRDAA